MRELGNVFGIFEKETLGEEELPAEVEKLIKQREEARNKKDWKQADFVREKIRQMGFIVEDTSEGPRWRKLKS
jgi:cysteinyl-tRNA synthetase